VTSVHLVAEFVAFVDAVEGLGEVGVEGEGRVPRQDLRVGFPAVAAEARVVDRAVVVEGLPRARRPWYHHVGAPAAGAVPARRGHINGSLRYPGDGTIPGQGGDTRGVVLPRYEVAAAPHPRVEGTHCAGGGVVVLQAPAGR